MASSYEPFPISSLYKIQFPQKFSKEQGSNIGTKLYPKNQYLVCKVKSKTKQASDLFPKQA